MAKKTDNSAAVLEAAADVAEAPISAADTEQIAEKPLANEPQIFVYLGPSIRGVVTNGRILSGSRAEVIKSLENAIKEYPQIERLIVADREVAKAKDDMKHKRGITIAYEALAKKLSGKED